MLFSKQIELLSSNYKRLFIIDGIGAVVSAVLLFTVLVYFQVSIGIPVSSLYILATFPIIFGLYDFYCFSKVSYTSAAFHLRLVAKANVFYCFVSAGFAAYHFTLLTVLGLIYIIVEIVTILCIAYIEFKVAATIDTD